MASKVGSPARSAFSSSPGVGERSPGVGRVQVDKAAIREDLGRAGVVARRLGQGLVGEPDQHRDVASVRRDKPEEDVGALHAGRNLGEELLEQRNGPLAVAGKTMEARRSEAALPGARGIGRRELGCELGEVRCGGGRPASGGMLRCCVEVRGDNGVRPGDGKRQVARLLLDVGHRLGQCAVNRAPLPGRRLLVADGREQGMGEADARIVELENSRLSGGSEGLEHARWSP